MVIFDGDNKKARVTKNTHVLDVMRSNGLLPGFKLEAILSKDAVWYNGATDAPTHNMEGYEKFDPLYFDNEDRRPNARVVGIVDMVDFETGRIVMTSSVYRPLDVKKRAKFDQGVYFIDSEVIKDFFIG